MLTPRLSLVSAPFRPSGDPALRRARRRDPTGARRRDERTQGDILTEFLVPAMAFLGLIAAASAGAFINVRLPTRHLAEDTVEVVRRLVDVFVVMTSVLLGLMLDSAKNTYETNNNNLHALATEIILLDRNMRTLGPEADDARRHLLEYVRTVLNEAQVLDEDRQAEADLNATGVTIRAIKVSDDQKLAVWNDMRQIYRQVQRDRWVVVDAAGGTIPAPLIVMMIFWLAAIFIGLGFRAPRNAVMTTTFVSAALLLSGALYLILEMDRPSSGLIHISNAPFQRALEQIQR